MKKQTTLLTRAFSLGALMCATLLQAQLPDPPKDWVEKLSYREETYDLTEKSAKGSQISLMDQGKMMPKQKVDEVEQYLDREGYTTTFIRTVSNSEDRSYFSNVATTIIDRTHIRQYAKDGSLLKSTLLKDIDPAMVQSPSNTLLMAPPQMNDDIAEELRKAGCQVREFRPGVWEIRHAEFDQLIDLNTRTLWDNSIENGEVVMRSEEKVTEITDGEFYIYKSVTSLPVKLRHGEVVQNHKIVSRTNFDFQRRDREGEERTRSAAALAAKAQNVTVFPNITSSTLLIQWPADVHVHLVELASGDGSIMRSLRPVRNEPLDVSSFPKGSYLLKIKTSKGTETHKFIKL